MNKELKVSAEIKEPKTEKVTLQDGIDADKYITVESGGVLNICFDKSNSGMNVAVTNNGAIYVNADEKTTMTVYKSKAEDKIAVLDELLERVTNAFKQCKINLDECMIVFEIAETLKAEISAEAQE